ncbi:MAG: phage holin family protein [Campylobacteraceae bacterium]|jgi:phage-related holin|nr:phage holin family protein [Campylobacteraceae bacterium]
MEKAQVDVGLSVITAGIASIFAFLGLNEIQFIILASLMGIDMLTGIAKAYRLNKRNITSHRMGLGCISKLLYLLVPLIIALAMKGLDVKFGEWLIAFTINALILTETYSNIANIYTFRTGKSVHEIDATSYILKAIKNQLDRLLDGGGKK